MEGNVHETPPIVLELMQWCLNRVPGRESRLRRVALLLLEFSDLLNDQIPIITVAGTSGKGTVCSMLESVLIRSGLVPGVCMKPHLSSFCERIRIGGSNVTCEVLELHTRSIWKRLKQFVEKHGADACPSLFESLMIIAASIFREQGVNVCVLEAAIGGSNDATSMLPSVLSILTSVALDHRDVLGNSIEAIAVDKAGIVRPGSTLVSGVGVIESVRPIVQHGCEQRGARFIQSTLDGISQVSEFAGGQEVEIRSLSDRRSVVLRFPGRHQLMNFGTVWTATKVLSEMNLVNEVAVLGVENAFLPGRFEFIKGSPSWLLDVAHNTASIDSLIRTTKQHFAGQELVAVLGATEPHDYSEFLGFILEMGIPIGFVSGFPKAVSLDRLAKLIKSNTQVIGLFESPVHCIDYFLENRGTKQSTIMVTGSLFLVGGVRSELSRRKVFADNMPS